MIKQLFIFLFLLSGNSGFSQVSDSLNDPDLFLKKFENNIRKHQSYESDWLWVRENNQLWYCKANKLHFRIQLFHYGSFGSWKKNLRLTITNLWGNNITSSSFNIDSSLILIDSLQLPTNIQSGQFVMIGHVGSPFNNDKILEEQFIIDTDNDIFHFLSKRDCYYNEYYLNFFLESTDRNLDDNNLLAIQARSKDGVPQKAKGYVLTKNFDTLSNFETDDNGLSVISPAPTKIDSIIVRVRWPDHIELDYDVPMVKQQSLLFEINLVNNVLQYRLWSSETYSAKIGWLMIIGTYMDKILFSSITNKTGKLFLFDNKFLLKNIPGGVIKLFIFKKGGEKIFEKKLFYYGLDTK